jgi:DNA-binding XRE family transcriptional regulator
MAALGNKPGAIPWGPDGLRACVDCGLLKARDDFVRIRQCVDGYYGRCRVCRNRRARERYHSSPEIRAAEIRTQLAQWGRRRIEARASAGPQPGGYILGLRRVRCAARLTQSALGRQAGVSRDTVGQLERGEHPARGPTINVLADALRISVKDLEVSATRPRD